MQKPTQPYHVEVQSLLWMMSQLSLAFLVLAGFFRIVSG